MPASKNYKSAIENYETAIRLNDKYAQAYYNLGYVYELKKEYSLAIENYNFALDIDPDYKLAQSQRSEVSLKREIGKRAKDIMISLDTAEVNKRIEEIYYKRRKFYLRRINGDEGPVGINNLATQRRFRFLLFVFVISWILLAWPMLECFDYEPECEASNSNYYWPVVLFLQWALCGRCRHPLNNVARQSSLCSD